MDPFPRLSLVWWWLIGACALVAVILLIAPWSDAGSARRQSVVEARGRSVMPFDQSSTTHRFTKTGSGGTETVRGHAMPGVQALARSAASETLAVTSVTVPGGAELEYRSTDPTVVRVVHTWFDAQVRDHGLRG